MPVSPFHEVQFPIDYSGGTSGGPVYSTRVTATDSGSEQRTQLWQNGRLRYEIGYTANPADMSAIVAFFRARKGRAFGFRFRDWSDYQVSHEPLVNAGGTTLQLQKTYTDAGGSEVRTVRKPCNNGTFQLWDNGSLVSGGSYTVAWATGVVTLPGGVAGGHAYAWSGEFDVPVRFETDQLRFEQETVARRSFQGVGVIEVVG